MGRVETDSAVIVNTVPAQSRVLVVILVKRVHLVLSLVEVVEKDPDQATSDE